MGLSTKSAYLGGPRLDLAHFRGSEARFGPFPRGPGLDLAHFEGVQAWIWPISRGSGAGFGPFRGVRGWIWPISGGPGLDLSNGDGNRLVNSSTTLELYMYDSPMPCMGQPLMILLCTLSFILLH